MIGLIGGFANAYSSKTLKKKSKKKKHGIF